MKMVIEIPEDVKAIIDRKGTNETVAETLWQAVKNGKTLQEGHGRLIDNDRNCEACKHHHDGGCDSWECEEEAEG